MPSSTEPDRIVLKSRKGKNFVADEEKQLCWSYLHVSQDPTTRNAHRSTSFWERVREHYNENRPPCGGERPARSLETKWGVIKHDVAMFIVNYQVAVAQCQSGTSSDDVLQKAMELYKSKHPKNQSFGFIHCWFLLKDIPRWAEHRDEAKRTTPVKRSAPAEIDPSFQIEVADVPTPKENSSLKRPQESPVKRSAPVEIDSSCQLEAADTPVPKENSSLKRPQGSRAAKEDQREMKLKEYALRAQAKATADMAAAIFNKARVMEDHNTMLLFTVSDDSLVSDEAKEYFKLRRMEELQKLRHRLATQASTPATSRQAPTSSRSQALHAPTQASLTQASPVLPSESDEDEYLY